MKPGPKPGEPQWWNPTGKAHKSRLPRPPGLIEQLSAAREAQGISQAELAHRLGYYPVSISTWETGRAKPIYNSLVDWANALGFDVVLEPRPSHVGHLTRPDDSGRGLKSSG